MFEGKDEYRLHTLDLFQKAWIDQRRFDSILIHRALESIVTKARYHMKGMHFAKAALTCWSSSHLCRSSITVCLSFGMLADHLGADHITFPVFLFFAI